MPPEAKFPDQVEIIEEAPLEETKAVETVETVEAVETEEAEE